MASGRSAKRFLTTSAKGVSAGVLPALALSALLLLGCGGGSSDTSGSTAATGGAAGEAGSASGQAGSGSATGAGADATGAASVGTPGQSSPGQPSSGRHGAPVPQPTAQEAPKITPQQRREATVASITLLSPSSQASSGGPPALPAQYTCDGKNTSPALRWQGVPQDTAELALFTMNLRPVDGKLFFDWAVAGLSPDLEEIEAGKLPKGAVVGRNGFGKTAYGLCPEGGEETYLFTLFALPEKLSPSQGFEPFALRKEVLDTSGNVGVLGLGYARG